MAAGPMNGSRGSAAALIATLLFAPVVARAQEPAPKPVKAEEAPAKPEVMIALVSGHMLRGALVEMEAGKRIVLLEAGAAEPRTISWSLVVQASVDGKPVHVAKERSSTP